MMESKSTLIFRSHLGGSDLEIEIGQNYRNQNLLDR